MNITLPAPPKEMDEMYPKYHALILELDQLNWKLMMFAREHPVTTLNWIIAMQAEKMLEERDRLPFYKERAELVSIDLRWWKDILKRSGILVCGDPCPTGHPEVPKDHIL